MRLLPSYCLEDATTPPSNLTHPHTTMTMKTDEVILGESAKDGSVDV